MEVPLLYRGCATHFNFVYHQLPVWNEFLSYSIYPYYFLRGSEKKTGRQIVTRRSRQRWCEICCWSDYTFSPRTIHSSFFSDCFSFLNSQSIPYLTGDDNQIMAKILMSLPPEFRVFGLIALGKSLRNDEETRSSSDTAFQQKRNESKPEEHKEQALTNQYGVHPFRHFLHSSALRTCW